MKYSLWTNALKKGINFQSHSYQANSLYHQNVFHITLVTGKNTVNGSSRLQYVFLFAVCSVILATILFVTLDNQ